MAKHQALLAGVAVSAVCAAPALAVAASDPTVSEVVVTADKAGLLERKPSSTVFGLIKPLIETPRAASLVSATTIERYGVKTIDDLVAVSPSTYTASFYGVPGALNVRGALADNYFQGFKLVENRGTYSTPIGDAAQIEIVRGPPSPAYGPGKIGGFLNFVPKSARSENLTRPVGEIDATLGSYDKKSLSGQFGAPVKLGAAQGGIYVYGEIDDSGSFYRGIHPKHQLGEVSVSYDLPEGWSLAADAFVYHSTGDTQTPGWNRLTQDLIDNRTYVTGRNTALSASGGVGYLTPGQTVPASAVVAFGSYPAIFTANFAFTNFGGGLYYPYPVVQPLGDARFVLDSGVGITRLSPRDVYVSRDDFSQTFTPAVVLGLSKSLPGDSLFRLQLFYNGLENKRFVSYGFPAWFRTNAFEARASYDFKLAGFGGLVAADTLVGVDYRSYQGRAMQSFNSGVIALDRRDLSVGATPTDTLCNPFRAGVTGDTVPANCLGWENDVHSTQADEGVFVTTDVTLAKRLDLMLGGRYDAYQVKSSDTGVLPFEAAGPISASKGDATYSASLTYKLGWGLMPYVTYARAASLETGQAGELQTRQVAGSGWLSRSDLTEGGVKFQLLNRTLVGSVDAYLQNRTQLAGLNSVTERTRSIGVEFEIRYLATRNLSFTLSGDSQHTEVLGPDTQTEYVPAYAVCGTSLACQTGSWGGAFLVFNFNAMPGRSGNYELSSIPHSVVSLYGNYITDEHAWGRAGVTLGGTYVSKTSGTIQNAVVYPAYAVANASAFYQRGPYEVEVNVDNLFDKLYFTPAADAIYVNLAALPSVGREWRVTLKRRF
jgi:iron complex outermembrane receptor protein